MIASTTSEGDVHRSLCMSQITLICSTHREHGLCTAAALVSILREIGPEVIFEEVRPADFDAFHKANNSVEVQSITEYREFAPCKQVPVDQYDIRVDVLFRMKAEMNEITRYVGMHSEEYRQLDQEHVNCMAEQGFGYLNSDAHSTREGRMSEIEDEIIRGTRDAAAIAALDRWRRHNREREVAMVANIYGYCGANNFETGIFLVGAAHRAGVGREIAKYACAKVPPIEWRFYEGQIN